MKTLLKLISVGALLALPLGVGCDDNAKEGNTDGGRGTGGRADGGGMGTGGAPRTDGGTDGGGMGTGGVTGTDARPDTGGMTGGMTGADGGDGPAGPIEFTDFVNDLIVNKTAANTLPETIADKTFRDSMNPAAFDLLFR